METPPESDIVTTHSVSENSSLERSGAYFVSLVDQGYDKAIGHFVQHEVAKLTNDTSKNNLEVAKLTNDMPKNNLKAAKIQSGTAKQQWENTKHDLKDAKIKRDTAQTNSDSCKMAFCLKLSQMKTSTSTS